MIKSSDLSFSQLSEECLLVSWPSLINMNTIRQVKALQEHLTPLKGLSECVPAYASLAIYYDDSQYDSSSIEKLVLDQLETVEIGEVKVDTWEVPVCYDPTFGPDQNKFAEERGVDHDELIRLHSNKSYTVLMRGFQPGFLYMGELDERLHLPRLAKPRAQVPPGSVAIADGQTGIYPLESPGGWNIIGCTPTQMLDFSNPEIIPIQQGDEVQFTPISLEAYHQIKQEHSGPGKI
jgi:inhibitor of KinA